METSLIINTRESSGFFSNYFIFIDNIKYCEINNIKPIMLLGGSDWFYNDGRENLWGAFFEPINDSNITQDYRFSSFFKLWDESFLCRQGKIMVWENIDNSTELQINRFEVNNIIQKIKPIKEIQDTIDNFVETNFKGKILGVHIRGTDYNFNYIDKYIEYINKYNDFDMIYVASDNQESIDNIKNTFNNVIFYDTNIRRNNINDSVLCYDLKNEDKVKHGQDVLVECSILSKCDHLICINSNVAAAALYMNPHMTFDLIYRSPEGG